MTNKVGGTTHGLREGLVLAGHGDEEVNGIGENYARGFASQPLCQFAALITEYVATGGHNERAWQLCQTII